MLRNLAYAAIVSLFTSNSFTAGQLKRVGDDVDVPSVSTSELAIALDAPETSPVVLDVRLEEDLASDPVLIPDASWRDPHAIDTWAEELSKNTPVVVYCVKGKWVSRSATTKLRAMGFEVTQLTGGIEAWKGDGKPTKAAPSR